MTARDCLCSIRNAIQQYRQKCAKTGSVRSPCPSAIFVSDRMLFLMGAKLIENGLPLCIDGVPVKWFPSAEAEFYIAPELGRIYDFSRSWSETVNPPKEGDE